MEVIEPPSEVSAYALASSLDYALPLHTTCDVPHLPQTGGEMIGGFVACQAKRGGFVAGGVDQYDRRDTENRVLAAKLAGRGAFGGRQVRLQPIESLQLGHD